MKTSNRYHRFPGFVYHLPRFTVDRKSIDVAVRPRKRSAAICSGCRLPAPGYDRLPKRPLRVHSALGIFRLSGLRHAARRLPPLQRRAGRAGPMGRRETHVDQSVYAAAGSLGARLSWKRTAEAFRASWEKVFDAVEYMVT
jgi:transposase